jgi:ubiquinone/menaquinone biosynthesis C-methylase UbiE
MSSGGDRTSEIIRQHWDRRATTFDNEAGHGLVSDEQRHAWHDVLSRLTGPPPQRVIDIGCGTGFLALRFAELGHAVTGIDLAPRMIDQARRNADDLGLQVDFSVDDAAGLDSPSETYDLLVARHVLWNLPEPRLGVAEWLRVLRPGGRLALIEGKWADNEALARAHSRPTSRVLALAVDAAAAAARHVRIPPTKLLNWKYRRLEIQLPFSGGPASAELVELLRASSVDDVTVQDLMNPALWGEVPEFRRYLVTGTRSADGGAGSP